ncbi:putative membrane protein [Dehalococcoides mccartyi GY50]|nr:putative membrane protein [Dehalococcoides mccartyi GY50]
MDVHEIIIKFGALLLCIATISSGQRILYKLFHWSPLIVLDKILPRFLSFFKVSPSLTTWYEVTATRKSIYNSFTLVFFLSLLSVLVLLFTGGWLVYLVTGLLGITQLNLLLVIGWVIIITIIYIPTASTQAALILFVKHPPKNNDLKSVIKDNLPEFTETWLKYFSHNWYYTPYLSLVLIVILTLIFLVNCPAWILNQTCMKKAPINLNNRKAMLDYYHFLAWISGVISAGILFWDTIFF